ncbi:MAG: hypothetical protein AYK18_08940 [Theionarchaea archaeon DG-70]|nr:MAG: hypothetical protein AYK18_08940 [Theionarchaea archaeon DG-70]
MVNLYHTYDTEKTHKSLFESCSVGDEDVFFFLHSSSKCGQAATAREQHEPNTSKEVIKCVN